MAESLDKTESRSRSDAAIRELAAGAREIADRDILKRLITSDAYQHAPVVLAYANLSDEVGTDELLRECLLSDKRLLLPRIHEKRGTFDAVEICDLDVDLKPGPYGIPEPRSELDAVQPGDIDLIILPGRAFDRNGNRVGRGGGMYDRFLSQPGVRATTIAIAYDCQVIPENISADPHDVRVGRLITESEDLRF